MYISAPSFRIRSIQWLLDRPGQVNTSPFTGRRTAVMTPWFGRWSAQIQLTPVVGEANVRRIRSFIARCRGSLNTFKVFATESAQNANSGVTASANAVQGASSMVLTGYGTALLEGQMVTVNDQLLQLTADQEAGGAIYFEPPLREAANAGTPVETSRPYALVYMANSGNGWSVDAGTVYGISFDVVEAVGEPIAAGAALSLDFKAQRYWKSGVRASALASVSGYAFARSGTQGAAAANGIIGFFAANVPAINTSGFYCSQATSNLALQSQAFDNAAWTKSGTTATADANLDPTGGFTADTLRDQTLGTSGNSTVQQAITFASAGTATIFFIAKAGTTPWIAVQAQGYAITTLGAVNPLCYFNLSTGTVGTALNGATGYMTPLANGFYICAIEFSLSGSDLAGNAIAYIAVGDNNPTFVRDGTHSIVLWHGQACQGGFGGRPPIIQTTTAAAGVGADDLEVAASLPNGDFIAWAVVNLGGIPGATVTPFAYSTGGAGGTSERLYTAIDNTGAWRLLSVAAGSVEQALPGNVLNAVPSTGGRSVLMVRRKNGVYSLAAKKPDGTIVIGADASASGAVPAATAVQIGALYNATQQINGRVEGLFQRNGTFTDAETTAILTAA